MLLLQKEAGPPDGALSEELLSSDHGELPKPDPVADRIRVNLGRLGQLLKENPYAQGRKATDRDDVLNALTRLYLDLGSYEGPEKSAFEEDLEQLRQRDRNYPRAATGLVWESGPGY